MNNQFIEYLHSKGLLTEHIEYLENEIAYYNSLSSNPFLPPSAKTKVDKANQSLLQELKQCLQQELKSLNEGEQK